MTDGACSIEMGSIGDLAAVMPVMRDSFDPAFGEAWSEGQCRGLMTLPGSKLAIARIDEQIIGFAFWRVTLDESELLLIAVAPTAQRKSVGRALVKSAVTESKQSGAKTMHVEMRTDNKALYFYVGMGFEQVGTRPNYYKRTDGGPTDAITLSRQL
jgi:[ribosomal protein S18]-alanine N-acetyltransferase